MFFARFELDGGDSLLHYMGWRTKARPRAPLSIVCVRCRECPPQRVQVESPDIERARLMGIAIPKPPKAKDVPVVRERDSTVADDRADSGVFRRSWTFWTRTSPLRTMTSCGFGRSLPSISSVSHEPFPSVQTTGIEEVDFEHRVQSLGELVRKVMRTAVSDA
jgi:hypothetical protein